MRLLLSSRHPRNSIYTTESGDVLYKVDKPFKVGTTIATIRKAVGTVRGVWQGDSIPMKTLEPRAKSPSPDKHSMEKQGPSTAHDSDRHSVDEKFADSDSEDEAGGSASDLPVLEGHFAVYAQVDFRTFRSSHFYYNGLDVSENDYFRKEGWSWYGRNRIFTASDGKEYRWELRVGHLEMFRDDQTVVRFQEYRPSLGPIMKGHQACLEIDDSCQSILDEIMLTFIFCHKLRKDRKREQRRAAS